MAAMDPVGQIAKITFEVLPVEFHCHRRLQPLPSGRAGITERVRRSRSPRIAVARRLQDRRYLACRDFMNRNPVMSSRQLHLNVNLLHSGVYASAWRLPESDPRACFDVGHYVRVARIAERGKLDAIFLADTPAVTDRIDYRPFLSMEPTIVLATIAASTSHIGLIATASTTYNEPYNIARRFATLDHASGGRAGWNAVTTADAA